jgi:predicted nicotinamide N-methyase
MRERGEALALSRRAALTQQGGQPLARYRDAHGVVARRSPFGAATGAGLEASA